jgi:hypothetical protein
VVHNAETLFTVRERKLEESVVDFRYVSADQVNSYQTLKYALLFFLLTPRASCCVSAELELTTGCVLQLHRQQHQG